MTPALQRVTVFVASIAAAAGASAQEPAFPAGHWESVSSETYSTPLHAVVTGAEFYLKIDVSNDGSFRGEWGEYYCSGVSVGAYGFATFPCRFSGNSERVSGRFGPGRQGVIDLGRLGRSAFSWAAPAAGELAIDLPKDWRGDAILWRARMTRDGKGKPTSTTPPGDAGPLLSANALYREFNKDSNAALATSRWQNAGSRRASRHPDRAQRRWRRDSHCRWLHEQSPGSCLRGSAGGQRHQRRRAVSLQVHRGEL